MLSSKKRLKRFSSIFKKEENSARSRVIGDDFDIIWERNEYPAKVGVVITKKTISKSVFRNRVKRLVYELLREEINRLRGNLVIVVKKNVAHYKKQDIREKLMVLVAKLK